MSTLFLDPPSKRMEDERYISVESPQQLAAWFEENPGCVEWCRKDADNLDALLETIRAVEWEDGGIADGLERMFHEGGDIGAEEFARAVCLALSGGPGVGGGIAEEWRKEREAARQRAEEEERRRQQEEEERRRREEEERRQAEEERQRRDEEERRRREEAERQKREEAERWQKEEKASEKTRGEVSAEERLRQLEEEMEIEVKARASGHATLTLPGGATMEMVWCPPGSFTMGSPVWESGREDDEKQHPVTLTEGFWMARYPVTQEQWESVMGYNPSVVKGSNLPVVCVDFHECQDFCLKTDLRLPTEAEWEYACRAGSRGPYSRLFLSHCGWFSENSEKRLHPVGRKKPNRWGLYDMHGNVWEWCSDWYGAYPAGKTTNPAGPDEGKGFVLRGGSAWCIARRCRSAFRGWRPPESWDDDRGFRPVCDFVT